MSVLTALIKTATVCLSAALIIGGVLLFGGIIILILSAAIAFRIGKS